MKETLLSVGSLLNVLFRWACFLEATEDFLSRMWRHCPTKIVAERPQLPGAPTQFLTPRIWMTKSPSGVDGEDLRILRVHPSDQTVGDPPIMNNRQASRRWFYPQWPIGTSGKQHEFCSIAKRSSRFTQKTNRFTRKRMTVQRRLGV